jgi:hypothetical protein
VSSVTIIREKKREKKRKEKKKAQKRTFSSDSHAGCDQSVVLQRSIVGVSQQTLVRIRIFDHFVQFHAADNVAALLGHVAAVKDGSEEAAVNGRLIENEGIFLIVARVATHCNANVLAARQLTVLDVLLVDEPT